MIRRKFLGSIALGAAGLTLSSFTPLKHLYFKNGIRVNIILNGGVNSKHLVDANGASVFLSHASGIKQTVEQTKIGADLLEHALAFTNYINTSYNGIQNATVFCSNSFTEAEWLTQKGARVYKSDAIDTIEPYRNDAAVFELAMEQLREKNEADLVLVLEDTDVAHYNQVDYYKVLEYYNTQIEQIVQVLQSKHSKGISVELKVVSTLGRNDDLDSDYVHHNNEEAQQAVCITIAPVAVV